MDERFWREKWEQNEIGFHESEGSPLLVKHFSKLNLPKGSRILVPLCGKTRDIAWLLSQGYRVVGIELSSLAIEQLFQELNTIPATIDLGTLRQYQAENIDIYVGDLFDLSKELAGAVDAIYDRAALVALPSETRIRYARHLNELTDTAPQLLITFEYDQSQYEGPPFSIPPEEVKARYRDTHKLSCVERLPVESAPGGVDASEAVWLLR